MRKAAQGLTSPAGATVIYDTHHVIKEHNDQSAAISTQDNVAYGGTNRMRIMDKDSILTDKLSGTY